MQPKRNVTAPLSPLARIQLWYVVLILVFAVFILRLFYLQVIRHDHYQKAALTNQLKQYEIPAERGAILAHNGSQETPLVLNETRYTLFADPKFIVNPAESALAVQRIVGGDAATYEAQMTTKDSRYQILAKLLTKEQSQQITDLKLKGVGTQPINQRTYPQGSLAAQVLGFVNSEGQGTYGVEQALDSILKGQPGQLKAITDASGVPLAANKDNLIINPVSGKRVLLSLDIGMQAQLEEILKKGIKSKDAPSGSALIMEAKTGAIKAMANYPTYKPSEYYKVEDASLFTNPAVSSPLEVGSVMKPLTTAAALDQGVVTIHSTYYDPSRFTIDDHVVSNIEEDGGPGRKSIRDILQLSLNTGATWLLMQMGGGKINEQARRTWHDYMVNHYQFGKNTGVEQGYEAAGSVPDPVDGYGLNIQYANTAFGQGMTATPLQMAAALTSVVNGGTYYQPHFVEAYVRDDGSKETINPKIVKTEVVSKAVSKQVRELMEYVVEKNYITYKMQAVPKAFIIGGKTGTAQIPSPNGGYYDNKFNGMFTGFVGGDEVEYVIVVRINEPKYVKYAGSGAAAPVFGELAHMLINNFGVKPKG